MIIISNKKLKQIKNLKDNLIMIEKEIDKTYIRIYYYE